MAMSDNSYLYTIICLVAMGGIPFIHYTCWMAMDDNSYLYTIYVWWPWVAFPLYTHYTCWMAMDDNSYLYTIYVW